MIQCVNIHCKAVTNHLSNQSDHDTRIWYHKMEEIKECPQAPFLSFSTPYRAIFLFALYPTWEPVHRLMKTDRGSKLLDGHTSSTPMIACDSQRPAWSVKRRRKKNERNIVRLEFEKPRHVTEQELFNFRRDKCKHRHMRWRRF